MRNGMARERAERRAHARKRARERYGLYFTEEDLCTIRRCLRRKSHPAGKVKREDVTNPEELMVIRIRKESSCKILYAIWYQEKWIPFVYSFRLGEIITVLPPCALSTRAPHLFGKWEQRLQKRRMGVFA